MANPRIIGGRLKATGTGAVGIFVSVDMDIEHVHEIDATAPLSITAGQTANVIGAEFDQAGVVNAGTLNSLPGDRAVYDALNYQARHANDIDDTAGIHHTQAALDAAYQPLDSTLTTLSALADAAGVLTNDGAGTLAWNAPATGTVTSIATGTGLTGGPITTSGTISDANTGVAAATYGDASNIPQIAVNAQGRITSAVNVAITAFTPINIYNETQAADGTSTIYYLLNYAAPGTIRVYIDGIRQPASDDVAPSDTVIFDTPPDAGATLLFDYEMEQA